jgi:hypothetical protein
MDTQSSTSQSTLTYCQAKLHSLTDLHEDIVALVSGLQNHDCSNCAKLSWKLMMSEIINAFSIEFIKREKDKMELLLHDIAAQTVADRASFGGVERIKSRSTVVGRAPEISNEFVALISRESSTTPSACQHDKLIEKLNQVQAVYAELLHMLKGSEDYSTNDLPNQDLHKLVANLRRQNEELHVTLMRIKEQHYQQQLSESMEQRKRYLSLQEEASQLRNQLTSELEAKKLRQEELQQTYKQLIEQQTKLNVAEQERENLSKQLIESNRRLEEVKSGFKVVYNAHKLLEKEYETMKQINSQLVNDLEVKSRSYEVSQQEFKRMQLMLHEQSEQTEANERTKVIECESLIASLNRAVQEEQTRVHTLEGQLREMNGQFSSTTAHCDSLTRERESSVEKYALLEARYGTILQQNRELNDNLQRLSSLHDTTCDENARLKKQAEELTAVHSCKSHQASDTKREEYIETLQQMILELESKLSEKSSLQMAVRAKDEYDGQVVNKLRKQVEQATTQVTLYQKRCEEIAEVVSQLQQALEQHKRDQRIFKTPLHPSTKRSSTHSKVLQLETMNFDLSEECRQLKHQLEQAKSNYDNSFSDMATQYKQTISRLVKENDYLQEMIAQQARTIDTINLKLVNEQAMNRQYEKELATLKQMIQKEKTRGAIEKDNLRTSIKLLSTENKKLVDKYNKAKIELKERDQVTIEKLPTFVNTPPPKPSKRRPSTPKKVIAVKKEPSIVKKEALHSISDDEDHSGPADYDIVPVKKEAKRK